MLKLGRDVVSEVVLRRRYAAGLKGLGAYSHAYIIYFMHKARKRYKITTHPRGRRDLPRVGVFSTRSPGRPNPIGLTVVRLVRVRRSVLRVRGLDALDGTPVLDIKPYDYYDIHRRISVPKWFMKVWRERGKRHVEKR